MVVGCEGLYGEEEEKGEDWWSWWRGMVRVRWFAAEEGVRRSKMRRCESDETEERIEGLCGEKEAL